MNEKCSRCGRLIHQGFVDGPLRADLCHSPGNRECVLVQQRDLLAEALRQMLITPVAEKATYRAARRTAYVILDRMMPGSLTACPGCRQPGAVVDGSVKVHFAKPTDQKPCPYSFANLLATE